MLKRAGDCFGLRINTMSHRPTLHEDDRVMAVFARDGCR
jgi:hypothetical protein